MPQQNNVTAPVRRNPWQLALWGLSFFLFLLTALAGYASYLWAQYPSITLDVETGLPHDMPWFYQASQAMPFLMTVFFCSLLVIFIHQAVKSEKYAGSPR